MKKKTYQSSLSPEAQLIWKELDRQTRKAIQKINPFQLERNIEIRRLKERGVTAPLLSEITGFSLQGVKVILYGHYRRPRNIPSDFGLLKRRIELEFKNFVEQVSKYLQQ